ncbi:5-formyltetrahydrofolate cyclo-ligase [Candidatus Dojkabacteria bacterium]|uniref:5-formyltetrahydrofolate cyclo-ligase n=1 Tax=Candidatus Dojkabacteria bacterium TaxID=2099670 RepID=A0A955RLL6_9BACT|nr:5-formyltetrahydrofolate cyclo-ligase [Candidatus Dojkabacteria bacterium]
MKKSIKSSLRAKYRNIKPESDYNSTNAINALITKYKVLNTQIFIYKSLKNEVPTKEIIDYCIKNNIQVFAPDKEALDVKPLNQVNPAPNYENMIAIVPGLAFTKDGKRLGRGGGWYDRFFAKHKVKRKIGLCFKEQILKDLPVEEHDILMDEVIIV